MSIEKILKSSVKYTQYDSLVLNIYYSSLLLETTEESIFKRFGLSRAQYNVLRILRGAKSTPMNLSDVQGRMLKPMSNTTRLVDKLLAKNLVHRIICPDNRRKVEITITSEGLNLLDDVAPVLREKHSNRLDNLTEDEQNNLIGLLEKLRA